MPGLNQDIASVNERNSSITYRIHEKLLASSSLESSKEQAKESQTILSIFFSVILTIMIAILDHCFSLSIFASP